MKKFIKYIAVLASVAFVSACNLDIMPEDSITGSQMAQSPTGLADAVTGCYQMFFGETDDNNAWYLRQYYQFADFSSDDVTYGHETEDELNMIFRYGERNENLGNVKIFWLQSYKILYSANTALSIAAQKTELTAEDYYLMGEAWFLKAFIVHSLARLYCEPYDPDNAANQAGVILRYDNLDADNKARATLKETYSYILDCLKNAEDNFKQGSSSRSANKGFASLAAVYAMYTRVYLYMSDWDKCIEYAGYALTESGGEVISAAEFMNTNNNNGEYNDNGYFAETYSYPETIWCCKFTAQDDQETGSIASMIYNSNGGGTWGEEGYSTDLLELMGGYGTAAFNDDVRSTFVQAPYPKNGLYLYGCTKFSGQGGDMTVNSPALLRVSEVYLNRAEAYAHKDMQTEALADVNEIRGNRLNPSSTTSLDDFKYDAADVAANENGLLGVVLDEKRIEFAFEAMRFFDLRRNHMDIVRQYWGFHTNTYVNGGVDVENTLPDLNADGITTAWDYNRLTLPIPAQERSNNPLCDQNPGY